MRKLSQINEGMFDQGIKRAHTQEIRQEDDINNLRHLKPVDMGGTVLWADNDLEEYGETLFTHQKAEDIIKDSDWRLPTLEEIAELDRCTVSYNSDTKCYKVTNNLHNNHNTLSFQSIGYLYTPNGKLFRDKRYYGWLEDRCAWSAVYTGTTYNIFNLSYDTDKLLYTRDTEHGKDEEYMDQKSKISVRLVKDK